MQSNLLTLVGALLLLTNLPSVFSAAQEYGIEYDPTCGVTTVFVTVPATNSLAVIESTTTHTETAYYTQYQTVVEVTTAKNPPSTQYTTVFVTGPTATETLYYTTVGTLESPNVPATSIDTISSNDVEYHTPSNVASTSIPNNGEGGSSASCLTGLITLYYTEVITIGPSQLVTFYNTKTTTITYPVTPSITTSGSNPSSYEGLPTSYVYETITVIPIPAQSAATNSRSIPSHLPESITSHNLVVTNSPLYYTGASGGSGYHSIYTGVGSQGWNSSTWSPSKSATSFSASTMNDNSGLVTTTSSGVPVPTASSGIASSGNVSTMTIVVSSSSLIRPPYTTPSSVGSSNTSGLTFSSRIVSTGTGGISTYISPSLSSLNLSVIFTPSGISTLNPTSTGSVSGSNLTSLAGTSSPYVTITASLNSSSTIHAASQNTTGLTSPISSPRNTNSTTTITITTRMTFSTSQSSAIISATSNSTLSASASSNKSPVNTTSTESTTSLATSNSAIGSSNTVVGTSTTSTTNATSSSTTTSAASATGLCGFRGDFLLNFDDLPPLGATNPNTVSPMPIFSPYHHMYFSGGFVVVPPPTDPYLPASSPLLLEFSQNFEVNGTLEPNGDNSNTGEISTGNNQVYPCYNFNMYGASFGCNSTGPNCHWQFTAVKYNAATSRYDEVHTEFVNTPACPGLSGCPLLFVQLDPGFLNVTAVRINVTVAGQEKAWWMDNLFLGWSDNTCSAGLCRLAHA